MRKILFGLLFFSGYSAMAQFHFGAFVGGASYIGELNDQPFKRTKPAIGISINYEVSDRVMLRSGLTVGSIEGADKYSGSAFVKQNRNLSFQSPLTELSLLGELTAFNLNTINWSPYAFAGISVYRFNPYVRDSGRKVYLQPLSTEGQGLTGSNTKPYNLTQFAIPFGGGVKFNLNDNVRMGFEIGVRRLFNDYLDDVSTNYTDPVLLLNERGANAVRFSYRGAEVPGSTPIYPDNGYARKGAERGAPKTKDWYYFTGLHFTFRLGGGYGKTFASGGSGKYGCPVNPMN